MSKSRKEELEQKSLITLYEKAVDIWRYSGNQFWASFNIFLLANSIIITIVSLSIPQKSLLELVVGSSFLGIALCLLWFFLMKRGWEHDNYWFKSIIELEEHLPSL